MDDDDITSTAKATEAEGMSTVAATPRGTTRARAQLSARRGDQGKGTENEWAGEQVENRGDMSSQMPSVRKKKWRVGGAKGLFCPLITSSILSVSDAPPFHGPMLTYTLAG